MRKEQERIAKQEEFRRQMEKILEAQQEVTFFMHARCKFYIVFL